MSTLNKIKNIYEKKYIKYPIKVLWWIILLFIGFYLNNLYSNLTSKPNIEIMMPENYNQNGIFPISLVNSGDLTLTNISVKINSPYMNATWRNFYPDDIPLKEKYVIEYSDENTLDVAQKIDCINSPFNNTQNGRAKIRTYKNITSGEIIIPTQNYLVYMCTYSDWEIEFYSDQLNRNFSKSMFMPVKYLLELNGNDAINLNSSDIIYTGDMIISYYDERTWKIAEDLELKKARNLNL
jgi:hypothetical protein